METRTQETVLCPQSLPGLLASLPPKDTSPVRPDTGSSASTTAKQSLTLNSREAHGVSHFTIRVPDELLPWAQCQVQLGST